MYYDLDNSSLNTGLQIGPYINLTLQQISVGLITNLIVFPPSLLLVQLFKRSKRRQTRLSNLKKLLNEYNLGYSMEENDDENDTKETKINAYPKKTRRLSLELKFPWWFKIVAYALSFLMACVCLFFVIAKGIVFGDEKVKKWITSVLVSFLSSVLLIQPLQVVFFFVKKIFKQRENILFIFKTKACFTDFIFSDFMSFV
jgi:polycystin 1L2